MGKGININWGNPYRRLSESELLDRIGLGDERAEDHLMQVYQPALVTYVTFLLRDKPEQLGLVGDFVQDALLTLLFKARKLGAAVLKDESRPIAGWLNKTASFLLLNASRRDRFHDRDQWQADEEDSEVPPSRLNNLADPSTDTVTTLMNDERDQLIRVVLQTQPDELQTLVRLKFTDGLSWDEISTFMMQMYPTRLPPFTADYLLKTFWSRTVGKHFRETLIDTLNRYGYDFRR